MSESRSALPQWFSRSKAVEHEIDGEERKFYRLKLPMLQKLRALSKELGDTVTVLFQAGADVVQQSDRETSEPVKLRLERENDESGAGFDDVALLRKDTERIRGAIDIEQAAVRMEQRREAIGKLLDAVTDEGNLHLLCLMVMSSMRDDFPRVEAIHVDEFRQEVEIPALIEMMFGVAKANFPKVLSFRTQIEEAVKARLTDILPGAKNLSSETGETTEDGETSTTISPTPSPEDSPPKS